MKRTDWREQYNYVVSLTGWTYEYIDAMPFTRFLDACEMQPLPLM